MVLLYYKYALIFALINEFFSQCSITVPFCYYTAGEPRKAAILNAQQLQDEKWAQESSISIPTFDNNDTAIDMVFLILLPIFTH